MSKQTLFDGDTFERNGFTFTFRTMRDEQMGEPWKEHDGHGIVSDWTTRDKKPGELILCTDRNSKRYYDVQETMRIAKRDGWGIGPEEVQALSTRLGHKPSKREIRAEAVRRDYEYLRGWCNDLWEWIGIIVESSDGRFKASLWGIESLSESSYFVEVAEDLADEVTEEIRAAGAKVNA